MVQRFPAGTATNKCFTPNEENEHKHWTVDDSSLKTVRSCRSLVELRTTFSRPRVATPRNFNLWETYRHVFWRRLGVLPQHLYVVHTHASKRVHTHSLGSKCAAGRFDFFLQTYPPVKCWFIFGEFVCKLESGWITLDLRLNSAMMRVVWGTSYFCLYVLVAPPVYSFLFKRNTNSFLEFFSFPAAHAVCKHRAPGVCKLLTMKGWYEGTHPVVTPTRNEFDESMANAS